MDTTRSDVDSVYGQRAMSDSAADDLVGMANRLADDVYSDKIRTLGEREGNEKDFKTLLAAHYWALREGEAASESQTGGSVSYAWAQAQADDATLTETRFGRQARTYLRSELSIGTEIARRR